MACSCNRTGPAMAGTVENKVFLNKIFYESREDSCPLIFDLQADEANFTQRLNLCKANPCGHGEGHGCNCNCNGNCGCGRWGDLCCDSVNCDSKFTVTNSCVTVNSFGLSEDSEFTAEDVTVDGFAVTSLEYADGRYAADLSGIMTEITKCPYAPVDRHICGGQGTADNCPVPCGNSGHFILVKTQGPWLAYVTIVLEGFVATNGRTANFNLTLKSKSGVPLTFTGSDNFAVNCAEIPCQAQSISPYLVFDFDACAVLLNPEITVGDSASGCPDSFNLTLTGNLVVTPNMFLQVIRPSLFALNATEVGVACDDVGQCDQWDSVPCAANPPRAAVKNTAACQCCDTNGYRF